MKIKIWCNGHGWVKTWSGKEITFTKQKAGAKPFDDYSEELLTCRIYIERKIMCNHDLIRVYQEA